MRKIEYIGSITLDALTQLAYVKAETTFQRTFKHHTGLTPGPYRDRA